jgi:hypothetical protein
LGRSQENRDPALGRRAGRKARRNRHRARDGRRGPCGPRAPSSCVRARGPPMAAIAQRIGRPRVLSRPQARRPRHRRRSEQARPVSSPTSRASARLVRRLSLRAREVVHTRRATRGSRVRRLPGEGAERGVVHPRLASHGRSGPSLTRRATRTGDANARAALRGVVPSLSRSATARLLDHLGGREAEGGRLAAESTRGASVGLAARRRRRRADVDGLAGERRPPRTPASRRRASLRRNRRSARSPVDSPGRGASAARARRRPWRGALGDGVLRTAGTEDRSESRRLPCHPPQHASSWRLLSLLPGASRSQSVDATLGGQAPGRTSRHAARRSRSPT